MRAGGKMAGAGGTARLAVLAVVIVPLAACTSTGMSTSDAPTEDGRLLPRPKTILDLRYENVVPQVLDFSCAAASLSTIMTFYWNRRINEEFVLRVLRARYPDPEVWKTKVDKGFSLDDLEFAAAAFGFNAAGVDLPASELSKLEGPIIVHLKKSEDFEHFSVLKMVRDGVAYMADPILGNTSFSMDKFEKQYTGKALGVWLNNSPLPKNPRLGVVHDGLSERDTLNSVDKLNNMRGIMPLLF